jgi:CRISPR-associated protein Cas1
MLSPLKPIAMKERVSLVFVQKGQIDVKDGAFVVIDETGIRTHIPVGSIACIMLEPGTRISQLGRRKLARIVHYQVGKMLLDSNMITRHQVCSRILVRF